MNVEPADIDTPPPPARHSVGVLFVHGIGEQPQGDTLLRFAQPIIDWVSKWLDQRWEPPAREAEQSESDSSSFLGKAIPENERRGAARLVYSVVNPSVVMRDGPPHAIYEITVRKPDASAAPASVSSSWMLAESWWASQFHKPQFGELAGWMLSIGTWIILSHAGKYAQADEGSRQPLKFIRLILKAGPVFVVSIPLALLVQILVAALAVLAAIPLPQLRSALSGILLTLTGTLGDSYVLVSSPLQRAAAVSHLRADLRWLSERCEKVVVVAHSQGAAIAHEALQSPEPRNVTRLITVGSGLAKLKELQFIFEHSPSFIPISRVAIPLFTLSIFFWPKLWSAYLHSDEPSAQLFAQLFLFLPLWMVILLLGVASKSSEIYLRRVNELSLKALPIKLAARPKRPNFWGVRRAGSQYQPLIMTLWEKLRRPSKQRANLRWTDYFSTWDLVPNGRLDTPRRRISGMRFRKIVNFMSWTRDHTSYWANRDGFVAPVVQEINKEAGSGLFRREDIWRIARAARKRRGRVLLLFTMRVVTVVAFALVVYGLRNQLSSFGKSFYQMLRATPVLELVAYGLRAAGVAALKLDALFTAYGPDQVKTFCYGALGAVAPAALLALWYALSARLWKWWDGATTTRLFASSSDANDEPAVFNNPIPWGGIVVTSIGVLFPLVVAVVTVDTLHTPNPYELMVRRSACFYSAFNLFLWGATYVVSGVLSIMGVVLLIEWMRKRWAERAG